MKLFIGLVAAVAILAGLFHLHQGTEGLSITKTTVGETPVTIFRPQTATPAPIVVIAHGFAGSQQLMQPFAETLARNGYMAVTFDFLGHGRNPTPMRGDITEGNAITAALLAELTDVAAWARKLPCSDGRLARTVSQRSAISFDDDAACAPSATSLSTASWRVSNTVS